MKTCQHTLTRTRADGSSWCESCGIKVYDIDPRECQHCAHFKDLGPTQDNHCICTWHMMGVARSMHVTFAVDKGTCFKERTP